MPLTQDHAKRTIQKLVEQYRSLSDNDRKIITEAGVVHQFVDPLLETLGWPTKDPRHFKYELSTQSGRPDITLIPEQGGTIFVEAKRFGVIQELREARFTVTGIITPGQLALPGMASDRTKEEQQAINYAFENGGQWAILTNFEKLRLFNARRDWLVLSFEKPIAYLDEFDQLWQLSYENILNGQLDLLSNQRHREDVDTSYLDFINEWRERLAQDIIARPGENSWAFEDGRVHLGRLRAAVQRVLDRLVVVRFAEDHLVAPAGTLFSFYEIRTRNPYTFSLGQFFQQLYRRFDEFHNSALFAPHLADQAVFSDETLGGLVQKLYEARYRAMSADIMGNTYEQYLGKTLVQVNGSVKTADNLETRKKQGSYYTPQVIVRYLVDNSLGRYLYGTTNGQPDGEAALGEARKTAAEIRQLRVMDPACGSGSFLIYAYQVLADFYRSEIKRLNHDLASKTAELAGSGLNPIDIRIELAPLRSEFDRLQEYPRLILENHLYGVDLDPQAAEIATVNLIMRAMTDQRKQSRVLPLILNQNVKVGNALIGAGPNDARYAEHAADLAELRRLRQKLVGTDHGDPVHDDSLQAIGEISERVNAALNESLAQHFDDVEAHRPFNWVVEFPEAFVDEQGQVVGDKAGFQVVIGNPPWEVIQPDLREFYAQFDSDIESRMTREQVEARIKELNSKDPTLQTKFEAQTNATKQIAAYFKLTVDYPNQGKGKSYTHNLFVERAYSLLGNTGRLGFVIPANIYSDLGTKELREMLLNEGQIEYLYNFSNERFFFTAVDHRVKFTLLGARKGVQSEGFWATFRFNPRVAVAPEDLFNFLGNSDNLIYIRRRSLARFSPDSLSVLEFQTKKDYEVAEKLYSGLPLIGETIDTSYQIKLGQEFNMTTDRHLFNTSGGPIAVYNGRVIHQFDASFAEPEFWISEKKAPEIRDGVRQQIREYRLGYRRIASPTNERTLIAAVIPPNVVSDTVALVQNATNRPVRLQTYLFLATMYNSFGLDFIIRKRIVTTVNMFYVYQLPLPRLTAGNPYFEAIVPRAARLTCITPDFAELWQEVMGEAWDESKGATDPAERQQFRNELDALVAHLYGLNRDDFEHILGTFPLVFPNNDEGRVKKERLLEVYDQFAEVVKGWPRQ